MFIFILNFLFNFEYNLSPLVVFIVDKIISSFFISLLFIGVFNDNFLLLLFFLVIYLIDLLIVFPILILNFVINKSYLVFLFVVSKPFGVLTFESILSLIFSFTKCLYKFDILMM